MTATDDPEGQISADIPEEVRHRIAAASEMQRTADALGVGRKSVIPAPNAKLRYAEPQNCILHFVSPSNPVVPSFGVIIGLSLCAECLLQVAQAIVSDGFSAKEFVADAIAGDWIS